MKKTLIAFAVAAALPASGMAANAKPAETGVAASGCHSMGDHNMFCPDKIVGVHMAPPETTGGEIKKNTLVHGWKITWDKKTEECIASVDMKQKKVVGYDCRAN